MRAAGPVLNNQRIVHAFARVPRERFFGRGPWFVHATGKSYLTPDADPRRLYHNIQVALNRRKGVNSGVPRFWAFLFDTLDVKRGDRVFQVGAGTGYFTAIIAEMVGPTGSVLAVEVDKGFELRARAALKPRRNVKVLGADASAVDPGEVDVIVVFAGGTHPPRQWLERLATGGRLLMPLVTDDCGGFMLKATRTRGGFSAAAVSRCGFVLAHGFRRERESRALKAALSRLKGKLPKLKRLHIGKAPRGHEHVFLAGDDYWLEGGGV